MTLLPIVDRELRVAARRKLTYWSRLLAAAVFAIVFGSILSEATQASGYGFSAGEIEFSALKWMLLALASLAGVFITSDALSEEKREGTMGLLFLTDLRGYDIVFGKLVSHSLRVFYGMLAVVPVVGLVLMMGGVTGREFWQVMLVICNGLLLALAVGMFVSSLSRDSVRAMTYALLISLAIFGGLLLADLALAGWDERKFKAYFSLASPCYLLYETSGSRFNNYWLCLGIQHGLAWLLLGLASLITPRTWRDKPHTSGGRWSALFRRLRLGSPRSRASRRSRALESSPVLWVMSRDRWLFWLLNFFAAQTLSVRVWAIYLQLHPANQTTIPQQDPIEPLSIILMILFIGGTFFWMAVQASQFFAESVHNGSMELLLVTPVSPGEIIRAQRIILRRALLFPALCVVLLIAGSDGVNIYLNYKFSHAPGIVPSPTPGFDFFQIASMLDDLLLIAGVLMATSWFGMWAGMTSRKTAWAVLKTLGLVVVVPWISFIFLQNLLIELLLRRYLGRWGSEFLLPGVWLLLDLWFILRSRSKLLNRFRELAARERRRPRRRFWRRLQPQGVA